MAEILRSLWGKLYAWALPSALALGAAWLVSRWQRGDSVDLCVGLADDKEGLVLLYLAVTGVLAISLSSISTTLYRLLEGYTWPRRLSEWGIRQQLARKKSLQAEVKVARSKLARAIAEDNLARYPLDDGEIVPTRFGNAIRAFETYGRTRFNMDSQTLWYELVAVAPKHIQLEIESARSSVDFFVASLYLSGVFGFACLLFGAVEKFTISVMILCIPAFLLTIVCHWLALRAIDAWGDPIRALINLGRVNLAHSLGLRLPETIKEEKIMWGLVANYANDPNEEYGEALNVYRTGTDPLDNRRAAKQSDRPSEDTIS